MGLVKMDEPLHIFNHPATNPQSFETSILGISNIDGKYWIELEESYYYPAGGGQPADLGTLELSECSIPIIDVRKKETIIHEIMGDFTPDNLVGKQVVAHFDTERRNQLARMHTAQHLVSAVADELFSGTTIGNQIGTEKTRIDLGIIDREAFDKEALVDAVNSIIESKLIVSMDFQQRSELISNPLVRVNLDLLPKAIEELRVITIDGVDICPCAGSHVANTSEIGSIEIGRVKSKGAGKLRVEYSIVE